MASENEELLAEFGVFEQNRAEWFRAHPNEFVVVGGGQVIGFFLDYESALKAGLQTFGAKKQFLVKQVSLEEPVFVIY
jgi:hypothetical protein